MGFPRDSVEAFCAHMTERVRRVAGWFRPRVFTGRSPHLANGKSETAWGFSEL